MNLKSLLSAFISTMDRVGLMRKLVVDSLSYSRKYPGLSDALSRQYLSSSREARFIYGELLKAIRRSVRQNPPTPLEILEVTFARLREQAEAADVAARKANRIGGRIASRTRKTATELNELTKKAARVLVEEAQRRGADMDWFIREYGLDNWLRE